MPREVMARRSMEPWLRDEIQFYRHQVEACRSLARKRSFLLADDMGLGKSLQAITLFIMDFLMGGNGIGIVVCPLSLKDNWSIEFDKFTRVNHMVLGRKINPRTGRPKLLTQYDRTIQIVEFAAMDTPKVIILNYEQIQAHLPFLNALNAGVGIFDEAHKMKNPDSKRTQAALDLVTRRSFMLTGTPLLNNVTELWPILHRIAPKTFDNSATFNNRYAVLGGSRGKSIMGTKNTEELNARLEMVMLRRLKKDVLDLPEVQYIQVPVPLSALQEKLYEQAHDEEELDNADPDGEVVVIRSALTVFLRLKQICGTPYAVTYDKKDDTLPEYADDSVKLDIAMDKAKELSAAGEKIVVFTQFRGVQAAFMRRLRAENIPCMEINGDTKERQAVVSAWGAVEGANVLVSMSQVGGEGFNMTQARVCFFLDKLFVPGLNKQCVDRLNRIGASLTQAIQVYEFIANGTVEDRIEEILKGKQMVSDSVIEETEVMRKVLKAMREAK